MEPYVFDVEKFRIELEERLAAARKRRDIFCPYCQHRQDEEIKYHYVTYWGEDGEKSCSCESCDKRFMVEEQVEREFTTRTMEAAEDEARRTRGDIEAYLSNSGEEKAKDS